MRETFQSAISPASPKRSPPTAPELPAGLYRKLEALLLEENLVSVALRGRGDRALFHMIAQEQRRRVNLTSHSSQNALYVGALVNRRIDNEDWGSDIRFFEEGIPHGDLFIDDGTGACGGESVKSLVEVHERIFSNHILTLGDAGAIPGYDQEKGDGWVHYRHQKPYNRRLAQDYASWRDTRTPEAILRLEEIGGTLYGFEHTVFALGNTVSSTARELIAKTLSTWERHGGKFLLIVAGDTQSFKRHGCHNVVTVPQQFNGDRVMLTQLLTALDRDLGWIDAAFTLDAPAWICQTLSRRIKDMTDPWRPWVVSLGDCLPMRAEVRLKGTAEEIWAPAALI